MPVPKQRHTKSRRDKRRQHLKPKQQLFSICPRCKSPVLSHRICQNCGYYKGREIINVLAKLERKKRKEKEKEVARAEGKEAKSRAQKGASKKKPLSMKELSKK